MWFLALLLGGILMDPTAGLTRVWRENFNSWPADWSTRQTQFTEEQSCARADPSCARTADGQMILSVRKDPDNPGKYLTGHVGTQGKLKFDAYGYFEAKVKMPAIPGALCSWWLAPVDDYASDDPSTPLNERHVEIDVVENGLGGRVHSTIWYRDPGQGFQEFHEPPPRITTDLGKPSALAEWHRFGVLWTPVSYTFLIDRVPVGTLTGGLSSSAVFPILSIKIPDYLLKYVDDTRLRELKMRTQWVEVWK